jgi:hypothetical protein
MGDFLQYALIKHGHHELTCKDDVAKKYIISLRWTRRLHVSPIKFLKENQNIKKMFLLPHTPTRPAPPPVMPAAGELKEGRLQGRRAWAWRAGAGPTTSWRRGGEAGEIGGQRKETTWPPANFLRPRGGRARYGALG